MRSCRGKAACLCACQGKAAKQAYPGDGTIPDIPEGGDLATWVAACEVLKQHCSYGSSLLSGASLQSAAHIPPSTWDFDADGP
eukprot:2344340-Pleurochrysis_carterae.AAC.1